MPYCQRGGEFQRRPGSQSNATEAEANEQLKTIREVGLEAVTMVELRSRPDCRALRCPGQKEVRVIF